MSHIEEGLFEAVIIDCDGENKTMSTPSEVSSEGAHAMSGEALDHESETTPSSSSNSNRKLEHSMSATGSEDQHVIGKAGSDRDDIQNLGMTSDKPLMDHSIASSHLPVITMDNSELEQKSSIFIPKDKQENPEFFIYFSTLDVEEKIRIMKKLIVLARFQDSSYMGSLFVDGFVNILLIDILEYKEINCFPVQLSIRLISSCFRDEKNCIALKNYFDTICYLVVKRPALLGLYYLDILEILANLLYYNRNIQLCADILKIKSSSRIKTTCSLYALNKLFKKKHRSKINIDEFINIGGYDILMETVSNVPENDDILLKNYQQCLKHLMSEQMLPFSQKNGLHWIQIAEVRDKLGEVLAFEIESLLRQFNTPHADSLSIRFKEQTNLDMLADVLSVIFPMCTDDNIEQALDEMEKYDHLNLDYSDSKHFKGDWWELHPFIEDRVPLLVAFCMAPDENSSKNSCILKLILAILGKPEMHKMFHKVWMFQFINDHLVTVTRHQDIKNCLLIFSRLFESSNEIEKLLQFKEIAPNLNIDRSLATKLTYFYCTEENMIELFNAALERLIHLKKRFASYFIGFNLDDVCESSLFETVFNSLMFTMPNNQVEIFRRLELVPKIKSALQQTSFAKSQKSSDFENSYILEHLLRTMFIGHHKHIDENTMFHIKEELQLSLEFVLYE